MKPKRMAAKRPRFLKFTTRYATAAYSDRTDLVNRIRLTVKDAYGNPDDLSDMSERRAEKDRARKRPLGKSYPVAVFTLPLELCRAAKLRSLLTPIINETFKDQDNFVYTDMAAASKGRKEDFEALVKLLMIAEDEAAGNAAVAALKKKWRELPQTHIKAMRPGATRRQHYSKDANSRNVGAVAALKELWRKEPRYRLMSLSESVRRVQDRISDMQPRINDKAWLKILSPTWKILKKNYSKAR